MIDIELPTHFYLGKEYDLAAKAIRDQPVLYESRNLTTHGVVVGMTGSGKTGLCIAILEEAAIDGIPCIVIDFKGDLCNLLLNFPELKPEDFAPWIDPDEARRKKIAPEEYAKQTAESWKKGLADWNQGPERINLLRQSAEFRIYTPGSEAGLPLSILQSFGAPKGKISREALHEKVDATTTAILGLTGAASDPLQSREHILIANLLVNAWMAGKDMDLPRLITQIQTPPLRKIGAFDVDTFYPEAERLKLAVALNNLLASPSFSTWITGEPLDLASMMYGPDGKPRQLIFYLAHLDDSQRMFFLTLLLGEVLTWTRSQPGTSNLRALLYIDEVFGYLPPHPNNPPSKQPLMTLLKQARAFGVGVLLATQNPVDLDYKALTNAGTWFVGKLQTERDKARLLEGLEGVASAHGTLTDRNHLDTVISSLGNRVFLLHNVHTGQPLLMHSRWALSYLAGPLTRDQVSQIMEPRKTQSPAETQPAVEAAARKCSACGTEMPPQAKFCMECGARLQAAGDKGKDVAFKQSMMQSAETVVPAAEHVPPVLPAGVIQYYLPAAPVAARVGESVTASLLYQARLLGFAEVLFQDRTQGQEHRRNYRLLCLPPRAGQPVGWGTAEPISDALAMTPDGHEARWTDVPDTANDPKKLKLLEKSLTDFLYNQAALTIYQNRALDLSSEPGEEHDAFVQRCRDAARRASEEGLAELKEKYRPKLEPLEANLQALQSELTKAQQAAKPSEQTLNQGGSLLDFLWSWGKSPQPPAAPPPEATQKAQKTQTELEKRQAALDKVKADWEADVKKLQIKWQKKAEEVKEARLTPRKSDVRVTHFGLAWAPFWHVAVEGSGTSLRLIPAYARAVGKQ